jgi:hypothetical protein
MIKNRKILMVLTSAVMALAIGAAALFSPSAVYAQTLANGGPVGELMGGRGESDTYLAQALGIPIDQLTAAKDAAWVAIIDQALADGLITDAQATSLKANGYKFHGRGRGLTCWLVNEANLDYEAALAAQLGITSEALTAARALARDLQIQAAVDSGEISAEQADQMRAHLALRTYIDRETMLANALGISVADLETARESGKTTSDLITELGLTEDGVTAALKLAVETALQQAVTDGVITQAQADQFLADTNLYSLDSFSGGPRGRGGMGEGMGEGMMGGGRHGRGGPRGGFTPPTTDDLPSTDPGD